MVSKNKSKPFYRMEGGYPLKGTVTVQGSKNASLPILAATILIDDTCVIKNCPDIQDVHCMEKLLQGIGCQIEKQEHTYRIHAKELAEVCFPKQEMKKMRSSIILMGAMLGRKKQVKVYYPGGCMLGKRPIDLHLYALTRLGAVIEQKKDMIYAACDELVGNEIKFPFPSVGATQNAILAAVKAKGHTVIYQAAKEPEIVSLCEFLNLAGAKITGAGTDTIALDGVETLQGITYEVPSDRIVAGTYLFGVMGTGGEITLEKAPVAQLTTVLELLKKMGAQVQYNDIQQTIHLQMKQRPVNCAHIETGVYPDFPTDLQSSLLTTACIGNGETIVTDHIFQQRFRIVEELERMGASITFLQDSQSVRIQGAAQLYGRNVIARELRGGAALVEAGLIAHGLTTVSDIGFIERGYEDIVRDYKKLGAKIEKGC